MKRRQLTNVRASVRQRLLTRSRQQHEEFQSLLTRYVVERLLYRLSRSRYSEEYILKGATLFALWGDPHRPTRDLDVLGTVTGDIRSLGEVFRDICGMHVVDDGVEFAGDGIRGEEIRGGQDSPGVRMLIPARIEAARILLQVDVGFGDSVVPAPETVDYPTLLEYPAPRLLVYPREAVVAEKFQAMVVLGMANSRMKDFYDVWILAKRFHFSGSRLAHAIRATFTRRGTPIPSGSIFRLLEEFADSEAKRAQWRGFIRKGGLDETVASLDQVVRFIREFLVPPTEYLMRSSRFEGVWPPGGPWTRLADSKNILRQSVPPPWTTAGSPRLECTPSRSRETPSGVRM